MNVFRGVAGRPKRAELVGRQRVVPGRNGGRGGRVLQTVNLDTYVSTRVFKTALRNDV